MSILDFVKRKKNKPGSGRAADSGDSFADRILRHRLTVAYRAVLIAVILVSVIAVVAVQMKNRVFEQWQEISYKEADINHGATLLTLGEKALFYSHDGAFCVDKKGETVWNQTYEMQEPLVDIRGNEVAIGDYNGHIIYVMSSDSIKGTIDTGMPIKSLAVSNQGVVAAVLDDSNNVTWIYLFGSDGNILAYFKTTMAQSGYPVKVSISDNGTLVGVSYLYMNRSTMRSSVAFYNFGPVGRNEIDNFVSSYDYADTIIPFVRFLGNDGAVAAGDGRLAFYEGDQKPVSTAEILVDGEVRGIYWSNDYVALVYNDVTGKSLFRVDIYDKKGKLSDTIFTDIQYHDIFLTGNKITIYNSIECLYHTIGGHDNFSGQLPEQVMRLIPLQRGHEFMAVTGSGVKVFKLI